MLFGLAIIASSLFSLSAAATAKCPVSNAVLDLPANQTQLAIPDGQVPVFIGLGLGTQNYTCTNGAYVSTGAVATLYDISCLYSSPIFPQIQNIAIQLLKTPPNRSHRRRQLPRVSGFTPADVSRVNSAMSKVSGITLGQHYFINFPAPSGAIAPQFDFVESQGNPDAFFTGSKKGALTVNPANVPFLQLSTVSGKLANTVFRVDTALGQPPATCSTEAENITVQYSAKYWGFS